MNKLQRYIIFLIQTNWSTVYIVGIVMYDERNKEHEVKLALHVYRKVSHLSLTSNHLYFK